MAGPREQFSTDVENYVEKRAPGGPAFSEGPNSLGRRWAKVSEAFCKQGFQRADP
jgi:hypothetical protein